MSSSPAHRNVVALASVVIVAFGLRLAGGVFLPVLTALFVAIVSLPVVRALERARVPRALATTLTLLLDAGVLSGVVALALGSITDLRAALPRYGAAFDALHRDVVAMLARAGASEDALGLDRILGALDVGSLVGTVLSEVTLVVSNVLLVVILVAFALFEHVAFERKLQILLGGNGNLERVADAARRVQRYLVVKTAISALVGLLVWACLAAIGVDFPLLWALLTFLLNYVPTIGPALATIPPVLIALLSLGPGGALAALVCQLVVHVVVGNVIEPRVFGEALGISTFVVMVSMVAWGWLWGPVGALLAVPLTRILVSVLELSPETRWLALLLLSAEGAEEKGRAWGWTPARGAPDAAAAPVTPIPETKLAPTDPGTSTPAPAARDAAE